MKQLRIMLQLMAVMVLIMMSDTWNCNTPFISARSGEVKKNTKTFRKALTADQADKDFVPYSDTYDKETGIRKIVKRQQVLRKVKKIKKTINTATNKPVNYIPEKVFQDTLKFQERLREEQERREHKRKREEERKHKRLVMQPAEEESDWSGDCWIACNKSRDDFEEIERFTNTTDYNYLLAFIQGLNLVSKMPTASECTFALIFTGDDFTDTQNNLTLEFLYTNISTFRPIFPTLKVAQLIGTNFSDIFPYCWATFDEFIDYIAFLLDGVDNDFNKFLISYLFT